MDTAARAIAIDDCLRQAYPDASCALHYENAFQLLIATVLSAQTTDARVNTITPQLFATYPDAHALAGAHAADVEAIIRPLGFFRQKTAALIGLAAALVERFDGEVPADLRQLTALRGVGRKTANVVLGNAFHIPGITVDTHVSRLARRMGFSTATRPEAIERDLMAILPRARWTMACHRLIFHGRKVCTARKPACEACVVRRLCPQIGVLS